MSQENDGLERFAKQKLTLLYGAKNEKLNQAVVLQQVLLTKLSKVILMDALQDRDLEYFSYFLAGWRRQTGSPRTFHVRNSKSASSSKSTPYNSPLYKTLDNFNE